MSSGVPILPPAGTGRTARLTAALKAIDDIISLDSVYCSRFHEFEKIELADLRQEFTIYIPQTVDLIADLFTEYTGDRCAACIKTFNLTDVIRDLQHVNLVPPEVQPPFVYTFWRDKRSFAERHVLIDNDPDLRFYRHDRNTGLTSARKNGYWQCNDLDALGEEYSRSNTVWRKFYNATAIVNLAYRSEFQPMNSQGFLCIDNMKGGFDDEACRYIMEILANILQFSMRMTLSVFFRMESSDEQAARKAQ